MKNTNMAIPGSTPTPTVQNENSLLLRVDRVYEKQQQLLAKLCEINNIMTGDDNTTQSDLKINCVMVYVDETENVLNFSLDLAGSILESIR